MRRLRTVAACNADAIREMIERAFEREAARQHIARMPRERREQLEREWAA